MEALDLFRRFFWTRLGLLDFVSAASDLPSTSITKQDVSETLRVDGVFLRVMASGRI